MSKKGKKRPASPAPHASQSPAKPVHTPPIQHSTPKHTSPASIAVVPEGQIAVKDDSFDGLIRFDRRVKWTLGAFAIIFVLFVLLKWHFVSLSVWNTTLPDGGPADRGLVAGTPRPIRMDDYAVGTPSLLSNVNKGYPIENETLGGLKSGLVTNVAKHIIVIFRPSQWGFFFLDAERGFSFSNLFGIFSLLVGSFLLFLILTKNLYYLSLTGSLALLLSSATVSWTFIPAYSIGYGSIATTLFLILLNEHKLPYILLQSVLLIFSAISFGLILYPPYQVPLVYLFTLIIICYLVQQRKEVFPIQAIGWKLLSLTLAMGVSGWILYQYYIDAQETLRAVASTVYPGSRSDLGGTGFIANWYSEYYSWFFNDAKFPKSWLNSCEYAHYLTFAPVIIPASIYLFVRNKQINWILFGLIFFTVFMLLWVEVGFPESIAKLTLLNMSPTRRAQVPMGVGSIFLTIVYLGSINKIRYQESTIINALAILGVFGFMLYTAYININDSDGLLKGYQLVIPVLFFTIMNLLLLFTLPIPYRIIIFCTALLIFLLPNIRVNPLSVGLSPITQHALYKTVKSIVDKDPDARWMVNGNQFITYMVTATGAKQITGVKYIPDRQHIMRVLDPKMKRDSAYNRYAHVTYQSYIDGKDSVIMVNQFEDAYVIAMDPCSPRLKQLNVKYQVFDHQPQPVEIRCMKPIVTMGSLTIYQANP